MTNLEARLKAHPDDPDAYYLLGRAHALAYATKRDTIRGFNRGEDFEPLPPACNDWNFGPGPDASKPLTGAQLAKHLDEAVKNLGKAIRLKREARYYLALASVLETAGESRVDLDPAHVLPSGHRRENASDSYVDAIPEQRAEQVARARVMHGTMDPGGGWTMEETVGALWNARDDKDAERKKIIRAILADYWFEHTVDAYFNAFALSLAREAKADLRPMGTLGLRVSVEAGEGFLRVSKTRPERTSDATRVAIVETAVKELSKQQQSGGITPIIFSMRSARLADLVQPDATVDFNLDGTGLRQAWTWIKPETGLLVWDPTGEGRITSGRQLFGSATWWMMFPDGYRALEALDDNRDGELSGDELRGIAAWFDRNCNGVSDVGEVLPIERLGIAAIAVNATGIEGGCLANPRGLRTSDGRVLPTYDWVAEPKKTRATDLR